MWDKTFTKSSITAVGLHLIPRQRTPRFAFDFSVATGSWFTVESKFHPPCLVFWKPQLLLQLDLHCLKIINVEIQQFAQRHTVTQQQSWLSKLTKLFCVVLLHSYHKLPFCSPPLALLLFICLSRRKTNFPWRTFFFIFLLKIFRGFTFQEPTGPSFCKWYLSLCSLIQVHCTKATGWQIEAPL